MPEKESMWDKRYLRFFTLKNFIGMLAGIIGGYVYYIKVGCTNGSCPISSNPWLTMLWGLMMGYLLGDMFNKETEKKETGSH